MPQYVSSLSTAYHMPSMPGLPHDLAKSLPPPSNAGSCAAAMAPPSASAARRVPVAAARDAILIWNVLRHVLAAGYGGTDMPAPLRTGIGVRHMQNQLAVLEGVLACSERRDLVEDLLHQIDHRQIRRGQAGLSTGRRLRRPLLRRSSSSRPRPHRVLDPMEGVGDGRASWLVTPRARNFSDPCRRRPPSIQARSCRTGGLRPHQQALGTRPAARCQPRPPEPAFATIMQQAGTDPGIARAARLAKARGRA